MVKLTMPSENDEVFSGMDFPCGGASVGVGPLEWLPFYPFYGVFPKKIVMFFVCYSV